MTFNEHGTAMQSILDEARTECASLAATSLDHGAAARDLALSATHLEDALTRYNSARYRMKGIWKRADPDARG